jgi:hypothetical protein
MVLLVGKGLRGGRGLFDGEALRLLFELAVCAQEKCPLGSSVSCGFIAERTGRPRSGTI